jgi:cytochrome o ubiquinol oxidase subunit 2
MRSRVLWTLLVAPLAAALSGCDAIVLRPFGDVALQQRDLVVWSTILMLLIIVPVMLLTMVFAWHYRSSNARAHYDPEWHHSTALELVIWSAPLLIIIALGALTWMGTHTLDPFRPLDRLDAARPLPKDARTLKVQAVAMDWKWLFIYPDYGVASVNELAAPVDVPVRFQITATSVMNTFYVPALAGMIYAMPAMETQLNAVINQAGDYEGFSGNYSGAGFSDMRFRFHGLPPAQFDAWIAGLRSAGGALDRASYLQLEKPSVREPVRHYARVDADLYDAIVNLCVDRNKMCQRDMAAIDARGGLGLESAYNLGRLEYDGVHGRPDTRREYVSALCATDPDPGSPLARAAQRASRAD